mgnify:CR=1 FL=1
MVQHSLVSCLLDAGLACPKTNPRPIPLGRSSPILLATDPPGECGQQELETDCFGHDKSFQTKRSVS